MKDIIISKLSKNMPNKLAGRLVRYYIEMKDFFSCGDYPNGLTIAGKFAETVFSILHYFIKKSINYSIDLNKLYNSLQKASNLCDSLRTHIFRAARDIYTFRSKREAAHISEQDPTYMDSILVETCSDWIIAEFLRIFCTKDDREAQKLIIKLIEPKERMPRVSAAVVLNKIKKKGDYEKVLGIAYFLRKFKSTRVFNSADIKDGIKRARVPMPSNIYRYLSLGVQRGHFQECQAKKEGLKSFEFLEQGYLHIKSLLEETM